MMITVDPAELSAASETMRACAVEAADIGSQLGSCVGCSMPPDIRASVDHIVATVDRLLDNSGSHFSMWATDLAGRAQIALTDSMTAGSMAGGPATALTVGAGAAIGMSVIGGNSFGDFSITNSAGLDSVLSGAGVIGGNSFGGLSITSSAGLDSVLTGAGVIGGIAPTRITFIDPATGLEAAPLLGSGVIGGGTNNSIGMSLTIAAENMRQRQAARLDGIRYSGVASGAMNLGAFSNPSNPFLTSSNDNRVKSIGAMSFTEWSNSMDIDTNNDGIPNGAQTNFRRNDY